ncbi:MAG: thiamine-phosphate kinase [Candidatus Acidiferrales bacterium]
MPDEDDLIRRILGVIPSISMTKGLRAGVPIGIGDDAMVIRTGGKKDLVVTVDAFLEDVHFLVDRHPPESVGCKALARATSDLAAMGARPAYFLLTLALPKARTGNWLDRVLKGMRVAAQSLGLRLVGGDTTESSLISMSITVIGEIAPGQAVTRSGAKPGDILLVSGTLGRAQLGLELVQHGLARNRRYKSLLVPHLYPRIRIELGAWLAEHGVASAMMDISDGLSTDLIRFCKASRVGARIYQERIPCVKLPASLGRLKGFGRLNDPLDMALHGGEDYELLFTVPKKMLKKLQSAPGAKAVQAIGEIHRGHGVSLVTKTGETRILKPLGWDPFRRN